MEHNGSSRETYGRYRRIEIGIAQALVAYAFGVPLKELCAPCRGDAYTAFVRHVAMYLTHVTFGLTLDEVGFGFGRDRSTASYACHKIEDLRDDPGLDRRLNLLEDMLRAAHVGATL